MDIVNLVKDKCMNVATDPESQSFFLKMVGDYYRYVSESASPDKLEDAKNGALEYYNKAQELADKSLGACNPIRLGLALNFSVFYYEIMNDHKKACDMAETSL